MNIIIKIKMTPAFEKKARKLLSRTVLDELFDHLEDHPEDGDIISGTAGVRKLRWKTGKNDRGKSGGARILYHYSKDILILLITIYNKSEQENISQQERNELRKIVPLLVEKYKNEVV